MKRIIDSNNDIVYIGNDAEVVLRLLTTEPSEVTEADEVIYEYILRSAEWVGELRIIDVKPIK